MEYKEEFNEITSATEVLTKDTEATDEYEPQFGDIPVAFDENAEEALPVSLPKKKKFPIHIPIILQLVS